MRRLVSASRALAAGLVFVASFNALPALFDLRQHLLAEASPGPATWAYLLLLATLIQISYAIYLWQLPDWSSLSVVAVVLLLLTATYAMVMGAVYLSNEQGWLVQLLQLSGAQASGTSTGWSFIMLCTTGLMSYLCGQVSLHWRGWSAVDS